MQKCPYCDFNSHALKGEVPHDDYVQHLLNDLQADAHYAQGREIGTIFIGGGTPSLLSGPAMQTLLDGVRACLPLAAGAEITMEANPGTVEADRFVDYQRAGVNRISIGVQSFSEPKLQRLGRIHGPEEAKRAARLASGLGLRSFNLDLMHGLPDQSLEEALDDLRQAIALNPPHLSWYQLTIEPNTLFGSRPPVLPDDDALWDIFEQGHQLPSAAGYQQYETSAYASQASSVSIISTTGALATTSASAAARTARSPSLTDVFCEPPKPATRAGIWKAVTLSVSMMWKKRINRLSSL